MVISRSSLRRLLFVIVIDSALMPPWLVKKSKNQSLMTNENEKVTNHNKNSGFSFKLQKQIIY